MVNDLEDLMMRLSVTVRELQAADGEDGFAPWVITCHREDHGCYAFVTWREGQDTLWTRLAVVVKDVATDRHNSSIAACIKRAGDQTLENYVSNYWSAATDSVAFSELFSPEEWELVVKAAETFG